MHDLNGGIPPSGLFWTVQLGEDAFRMSEDGRFAHLHARNVPLIDSFVFLGPNAIPGSVSIDVTWRATGAPVARGKGSSVVATDPAAFLARFRRARATGRVSGTELGFGFKSGPLNSDRGFAELGRERNGSFL